MLITPDQYSAEHLNTLAAMTDRGGSFVAALAEAWRRADSENHGKLYAAFSGYYNEYHAAGNRQDRPSVLTGEDVADLERETETRGDANDERRGPR